MDQNTLFKEYKGVFDTETEELSVKKEFVYSWSPFVLQDAVGEKDIKKIWIEYRRVLDSGVSTEEIFHKITSKVRDMLGILQGLTKEDLDIKSDYPYNKSKQHSKKWSLKELKYFYQKLVFTYHKVRLPKERDNLDYFSNDLEISLEILILSL